MRACSHGLTSLGAKVGLTGRGYADEAGRLTFPVTGGSLTPALKGRVNHTGGIQFTAKSGIKFGIQQFVIDTTGSPGPHRRANPRWLPARHPRAGRLDQRHRRLQRSPATVVSGTLKLTDIGALYINTFLGTAAVKRGTRSARLRPR